jgi:hypothetical protein
LIACINAIVRPPKPTGGHSTASARWSNAIGAVQAVVAGGRRAVAAALADGTAGVAAEPKQRRLSNRAPRQKSQAFFCDLS